MTSVQRLRVKYERHILHECVRCSEAVNRIFWTKAGLCPHGRRLMDRLRLAGDKELQISQEERKA